MHEAAREWVREWVPPFGASVLDVGGRDVNGGCRDLFNADSVWTVVDLEPDESVDVVGDIRELVDLDEFDVVLCLEVLEHVEDWRGVLDACVDHCVSGGVVIVTAAGPGRAPHSAVDGCGVRPGEWYRNVTPDDLFVAMSRRLVGVESDHLGLDVRAVGRVP